VTNFIFTEAGEINAAYIVRAISRRSKGDKSTYMDVWYREGREVLHTTAPDITSLSDRTAPVIPAQPGYFVVMMDPESPYDTLSDAVIAWRIDENCATPICYYLDDLLSLRNPWGVLAPNSKVIVQNDRMYDTVAAFREDQIKQLKERKAAELARAAAAVRIMTEKARGLSYEQYRAAGWTDAQLIEHGLMKAAA